MPGILVIGTSDTKAEERVYLNSLLRRQHPDVRLVDILTRVAAIQADITPAQVAAFHPEGPSAVQGGTDRGAAVAAMGAALARFLALQTDLAGVIGIGGGGGTSMICAGLRELPYGLPKIMVSTLASGDVSPYVGISDIIMD